MILNTGMRTDIPAFYSEWFMNRIKEGYVYTINPYNRECVTKYSLDPSIIDCLAFCTKNPLPMLKYIDILKSKYNMYWFVTITPYGKDIEPNVLNKREVIEGFKKLSSMLGIDKVAWRYDPIFFNDEFDIEKHIKCFNYMAKSLKGFVKNVTISFLDIYEKVKKNAPELIAPSKEDEIKILSKFNKIAEENDMIINACCEKDYLLSTGVKLNGCMSKEIIEEAIGYKLKIPKKKNVRESCTCVLGNDIGAYNSCMHLCKYCYANYDKNLVIRNFKKHDKNSPLLIGNIDNSFKVKSALQVSFKALEGDKGQISLFN